MPLYRIIFSEQQGYTVSCRVRAAGQTPLEVIGLAVHKVWGAHACWVPFDETTGCVWEYVSDTRPVVRLGESTVRVEPVTRRRAPTAP